MKVLLGAELGDPVRRERLEWALLGGRPIALAVDRAAGGREDDLRARRSCRLEHLDGADDVDGGVVVGPLERGLDVGLGGEMEDDVGVAQLEAAADVALDERRGRVHVLALPEGEVVDDRDLVAALDEPVDQVRSDEPGSTGDDRPHAPVS